MDDFTNIFRTLFEASDAEAARESEPEQDAETIREEIKSVSSGNVDVDDSIKSLEYLNSLMRDAQDAYSYHELFNPGKIYISDPTPGSAPIFARLQGSFTPYRSSGDIEITNTESPELLEAEVENGWWTTPSVALHEMGHASENWLSGLPNRLWAEEEDSNEKYKGKYRAGDIIGNLLTNFGRTLKGEPRLDLSEQYNDMKYYKNEEARKKYDSIINWDLDSGTRETLYKKALEDVGVNDDSDSRAHISDYAKTNIGEAIAEAYADVIYNGDFAQPFSKALINRYIEHANELYGKARKKNAAAEAQKTLSKQLPNEGTLPFIANWRSLVK